MAHINTIEPEQINHLNPRDLVDLLSLLLHLECDKYRNEFPNWEISVPKNITTADGGEDGRFEFDRIVKNTLNSSSRLRNRLILFQSKATKLNPQDYKDEISSDEFKDVTKKGKPVRQKTGNKIIKSRIKDVLDNDGLYVIFTTESIVPKNKEGKIDKMREAIKEATNGSDTLSKNANLEIWDANIIAAWVNEHLGAKYFIWWKLNQERPFGLQVWEELETYYANSFFENEKISQYFTIIQNHCKTNDDNVLRIIGHSGLGKSRLICEAFRCETDYVLSDANSKTVLKNKVLYTDVSNISDDIVNFIKAINTNHGIIILDNCSTELHEKIEKEATRTGCNLRFITIDYDIVSIPKYNCKIIKLENTDFNDVIEKILDNDFGSKFIESDIKQITKIAEGYPQMAVWIAEGIRDNHADFNEILEDNFIKKVIFGREAKNETDYKILKTCAIFKEYHVLQAKNRMNYHGQELSELDAHFDFIEKHLLKEKFTKQELNAVFEKYIKKGVIERRGNKLLIRPLPIAVLLAADWWKEQYLTAQECRDLFEPILKNRFMAEQLAERIVMLKNVENVQSIIKILFDDSPFGQAEVLNTNWGSR
ncbi:MAG: hypothetical protein RLZZ292_1760, partial [Bacteroidota bacterium]